MNLKEELKVKLIEQLNLEEMSPEDIANDVALFGGDLGFRKLGEVCIAFGDRLRRLLSFLFDDLPQTARLDLFARRQEEVGLQLVQ